MAAESGASQSPVFEEVERCQPATFLLPVVQNEMKIKPAPGLNVNLGHVDPPDAVGQRGAGLVAQRAAASAQGLCVNGQKMMFAQETIDPVFTDAQALAITQVRPDAAVSPRGMIGLERMNACEHRLVADGDRSGALPFWFLLYSPGL